MFNFSKDNFEVIPKGIYFAKLKDKPELKESGFYKNPDGTAQQYVLYKFEIISDNLGKTEFAGKTVIAKPGPRSAKNMDIYNALTGQELETVDTDGSELEGRTCQLYVTKSNNPKGEAQNKIEAFIPMQQNTVHPQASEVPVAPPLPNPEDFDKDGQIDSNEAPPIEETDPEAPIDINNIPF